MLLLSASQLARSLPPGESAKPSPGCRRQRERHQLTHRASQPTNSPTDRPGYYISLISFVSRMASATSRIDLRLFMLAFWILRKASCSLRP